MQLDWHLITALIERWKLETHTFHMPCGECTITLLDVAVQLGLLVDGELVVGSLNYDWKDVDVVSIRDTLVHTQLIGGFLFADKSNTLVHCIFLSLLIDFDQADTYAWGATCLAWLYRKLCRASSTWSLEIINPLMFLQV
ncbi:serine/threonine-protein phosphatase 7 long form homolog [Cucumis sativus]|uniref:serine/threonine-protein phosphatase 7 long form homolog n=1 Tax=Cucumis sativus TaxID=3659 RepID=UPI0005ECAFD7|nr:serine/threonine-protein phosphatase 7 long form homolog [Cucumis sativus]